MTYVLRLGRSPIAEIARGDTLTLTDTPSGVSAAKESKEDIAKCEECLPRDQAERLFTHGLHEDQIFNSRLNNFLLIQAVLLTGFSVLQHDAPRRWRTVPVLAAAVLLSGVWMYVQIRQKKKLDVIIRRLEKFQPEFGRTRRWTRPPKCCPTATALLAYVVPALFGLLWLIITGSLFWDS